MVNRTISHPREKCLDCQFYKLIRLFGIWQCRYGLDPLFLPDKDDPEKIVCVCYGFMDKWKDGKPTEETAPAMRDLQKRVARIQGKKKEE